MADRRWAASAAGSASALRCRSGGGRGKPPGSPAPAVPAPGAARRTQLVVGEQPPLGRVAPTDDPVLDRPAEEAKLVGGAIAPVVVQAESVILVGSELARAVAQPPDLPDLGARALAVPATASCRLFGRLNSAFGLTC